MNTDLFLYFFCIGTTGIIAASLGLAGVGATLIGNNAQRKAQSGADNANKYEVQKADNAAWNNYLMQRGLYTGGTAPIGVIPGMTAGAGVNTRLPLWATAQQRSVSPITGMTKLSAPTAIKPPTATGRRPIGFRNGQIVYSE